MGKLSGWLLVALAVSAAGCFRIGFDPLTDPDSDAADSGADVAGDADADTDTDVDGDIDTDVDGDIDTDVDGDIDTDVDGDIDAGADASVDGDPDADDDIDGGSGGRPVLPGIAVDLGWDHTCVAFGDELACFGAGASYALGLSDELDRAIPALVPSLSGVAGIVTGSQVSCAVSELGTVRCFGAAESGQLGDGTLAARSVGPEVALPSPVVQLGGRFSHLCARLETADLYCWGRGAEGQLGQGEPLPEVPPDHPAPVSVDVDGRTVLAHCAGLGHTCAISGGGRVYCWGSNDHGELGLGDGADAQVRTPTRLSTSTNWKDLTCGEHHTCGLRNSGELWCWGLEGEGGPGPLGLPGAGSYTEPTIVPGYTDWTVISTHSFHSCGIRGLGELWCWGRNAEGQLGTGDDVDVEAPQRVGTRTDWVRVSTGRSHTCAQRTDGTTLCTGQGPAVGIGLGPAEQVLVFTPIAGLSGE